MWIIGLVILVSVVFFFTTQEGATPKDFKSYKENGMWQDYNGIYTTFEPADLDLYRKLLPPQLDMPEQPMVSMFVVDYVTVMPFPMSPYLEGSVAIKCKYKGEDGWHVLNMPVTTRVANAAGRLIGYPKYVADEILLEKTDQGIRGVVRHRNEVRICLEYTPGLSRPLTSAETTALEISAKGATEPRFLLVPPAKGPTLKKITIEERVPSRWENEIGIVKIHIHPNDPWAGLAAGDIAEVGQFRRFKGGFIMLNKKVN